MKLFESKKIDKISTRLVEAKRLKNGTSDSFTISSGSDKKEFKVSPKVASFMNKIAANIEGILPKDWYYEVGISANWYAQKDDSPTEDRFTTWKFLKPDSSWDNPNLYGYTIHIGKEDFRGAWRGNMVAASLTEKIDGFMMMHIQHEWRPVTVVDKDDKSARLIVKEGDVNDYTFKMDKSFQGLDLKAVNFSRPSKKGNLDQCLDEAYKSIKAALKKLGH